MDRVAHATRRLVILRERGPLFSPSTASILTEPSEYMF